MNLGKNDVETGKTWMEPTEEASDELDELLTALEELCDASMCSLVLCLGGSPGVKAVKAISTRLVPGFGSLMRSACLESGNAAEGLLGEWSAGLREGGGIVLSLPTAVGPALACVETLLPSMGYAALQGGRPPLSVR